MCEVEEGYINMKIVLSILTSLLWGASNLLDKIAVDGSPVSLTFAAYSAVSCVLSLAVLLWDRHKIIPFMATLRSSAHHRKALVAAMLAGFTACLGALLFIMALQRCNEVHVVSAIAYTAPVFTLLLGKLFMSKATRIVWPHLVAMAMIVGGVVIVTMV